MCWVCYANDLKAHIAEKNINVYKIVAEATKESCISQYRRFHYYTDVEPAKIDILMQDNVYGDYLRILEGYHSYKYIRIPFDSAESSSFFGTTVKPIILGKKFDVLCIDNEFYLATFVIPKGSLYFTNERDAIVSNRIRYTGKFIKL